MNTSEPNIPDNKSSETDKPRKKRFRRRTIALIIVGAHILGFLTSVRAVMEVRTPQGAIAWVFALNTIPYVSVPAYWIFGQSQFEGYITARRESEADVIPIAEQFREDLAQRDLLARPLEDQVVGKLARLPKLAELPFTTGNDVELLIDGKATFDSIFTGIEQAEKYVLVQFYILRDDETGRKLQQLLIDKAATGVRVHLIYDGMGSARLPSAYLTKLRDAGVIVRPFTTIQGKINRWEINFRNHRKIVVTDGKTAWVGGLNVGDEYLGKDPAFGEWRDTHIKVTGPAALSVQMTFLEDWHWSGNEILELNWDPQPAPSGARTSVLSLPSGPADPIETCTLFFLSAINSATDRLWIATPYFVPDEQIISALQLAALRNVDVRILIPDKTDNFLVNLSGWSYLPELEKTNIKVFRYTKGFMHQKVMLIDDHFATISTANFDNRSFRLNFEISIAVADKNFASNVHDMLTIDFSNAREVHAREFQESSFLKRLSVRTARLLAPIQ